STTVTCAALDAAGNTGHGSFTVHVKGATEQLAALLVDVTGAGPGASLAAKVADVRRQATKGRKPAACGSLGAFQNEVRAQRGRRLPAAEAASLAASARNVGAVLGC